MLILLFPNENNLFLCSGPDFVASVEDADHVYFFFREEAVEYMNCGKVRLSRQIMGNNNSPAPTSRNYSIHLSSLSSTMMSLQMSANIFYLH